METEPTLLLVLISVFELKNFEVLRALLVIDGRETIRKRSGLSIVERGFRQKDKLTVSTELKR